MKKPAEELETVGLRELSNSLSSFVRKVSLGVRVLITDRGRVVAEIREANSSEEKDGHPLLLAMESEGELRRGSGRRVKFPRGRSVMPKTNSDNLLAEVRGD
jgi:antitoxin (DNA-binding transcriptional repressor) of toxin-antitoxin stability system